MASRIKERGGGGGKILASKPQKTLTESTPKSNSAPNGGGASLRRTPVPSSGKENPLKSINGGKVSALRSRIVPKLADRPAAAAIGGGGGGGIGGVRWSTSSLPRGRAPSPSNPSRFLSDGRSDRRLTRVSSSDGSSKVLGQELDADAGGRKSIGGIRVSENGQAGKVISTLESKGRDEVQKPKSSSFIGLKTLKTDLKLTDSSLDGKGKTASTIITISENCLLKDANSSEVKENSISSRFLQNEISHLAPRARVRNVGIGAPVEQSQNKSGLGDGIDAGIIRDINDSVMHADSFPCSSKFPGHAIVKLVRPITTASSSDMRSKDLNFEKDFIFMDHKVEIQERKIDSIMVFDKAGDEAKSSHSINIYPSKLHEKLALLEGKVQKIALEIKRTKDILDNSNPDESKLILYDIQSKISGIEKAVDQVLEGSQAQVGSSKEMRVANLQNKKAVSGNCGEEYSKGKLVKGLNHEELEARFFPHHKLLRSRDLSDASSKATKDGDAKDLHLSPDENSIAMEFLASLDPEQSEISMRTATSKAGHGATREVVVGANYSEAQSISNEAIIGQCKGDIDLLANETLEESDDQENKPTMVVHQDIEEPSIFQLSEIGQKPSTGGWFVSEGEAALLAHDDGSCSYYDIAHSEFKAEFKPPLGVPNNLWADCWLICAPGADGCSGKFVVAASAGNTLDSGFCSWDFYTRSVTGFHVEDEVPNCVSRLSSRTALAPLSNSILNRRSASSAMSTVEQPQWWYRPCGPLLLSTSSRQKIVTAYDIRDGDAVMKWETNSPVTAMEYSCPLQWRSRGKVIIAGTDVISLWDVNSLNPQPLLSVTSANKRVYSLHVNNTDAELGGGVRQRVSSSEVEGNDGVFCTQESINVFDFRLPDGIGLKISRHGAIGHSIFSRGDSIFIGSTEGRLPLKGGPISHVQQYSLRRAKLVTTYELPESNTHIHHSSITQVWGNTDTVMSICGMGLFVFDVLKDEGMQTFCFDRANTIEAKETISPDDLYCPTFDYLGSRVLVISRDRPAFWRSNPSSPRVSSRDSSGKIRGAAFQLSS